MAKASRRSSTAYPRDVSTLIPPVIVIPRQRVKHAPATTALRADRNNYQQMMYREAAAAKRKRRKERNLMTLGRKLARAR